MPDACPLCKRPNYNPTDHHLVPKCRGGKETLTLCRDCHRAIHECFPNKDLEREYNTVETLMADDRMRRMVGYIARQDGRVKFHGKNRKWGRNG